MTTVSFWCLLIVVSKIIYFVDANWITGNLCWSMPCLNGGSCFGSAYTYLCICPIHYAGVLCEKRLGICQENPCGNRGLCVEKSLTTYECRCYYDYMGPTCEEHVEKNDTTIWSSLSPVHTRILFDMLQDAYNIKSKKELELGSDNGQIDFFDLLPTLPPPLSTTTMMIPIVDTTFTNEQIETTEIEHIIPANNIQMNKIFPDIDNISTVEMNTEQYSTTPENDTNIIFENITIKASELTQSNINDHTNYTEESNTIITSTSIQWLNESSTMSIKNKNESDSIKIIESIDNDNNSYSSLNISQQLTSMNSSDLSKTEHSHLLYKLYENIITHILSNASTINTLPLPLRPSSNTLLSLFRKHLSSSTNPISTSTISSLIMHEKSTLPVPLKRIDMDDALHQNNNNEH